MAEQRTRRGCPKCGSKRFKAAPSQPDEPSGGGDLASFFALRECVCKDCGTRYKPTMPPWAPYAFISLGVLLAIVGIAMFFTPLMKGSLRFSWWVKYGMFLVGVFMGVAGVQMRRKKGA